MSKQRLQQVADTMQRIIGEVIQYEVKDPRVGFATVTGVEVSADLQRARVRVSIMGDAAQQAETLAGLEHAKGFIRKRVAEEMRHMRFIPELQIIHDTSLDYSMRIQEVLREVEEQRKANPPKLDEEA
ncbi:MAG: 30S ribosome-binding factor RbfA [Chloroflexi bacterium]|nr:30S ribosome-binding factor RbfA [Chloroflexota bacterium]